MSTYLSVVATSVMTQTFLVRVPDLDPLLEAIRQVETGGKPRGGRFAIGDRGRSFGPFQISKKYFEDSGIPGPFGQVRYRPNAERVMLAYWLRHCPRALERGDFQTLARVHNGGRQGARKAATRAYWKKIKEELSHRGR